VLADHVRHVIQDAGLGLGEDAVDHVVRQGGGSARDTLSALDQVSAMGGVVEQGQPAEAILQALVDHDAGAALVAVADATDSGRDPRALGEVLIASLRDAFLAAMGAPDRHLPPGDAERAATLGAALGPAGLTRALEVLGEALVELAKKPDPRIVLEVALVRLCRPDADRSLDAVVDRLERLERALADGTAVAPPAAGSTTGGALAAVAAPAPADASSGRTGGPADDARAELARSVGKGAGSRPRVTKATAPRAAAAPAVAPAPEEPAEPAALPEPAAEAAAQATAPTATPAADGAGVPSRDELTLAWGDQLLDQLPRGTKAIFSTGRFVEGDGSSAVFALANAPTRDHCEKKRADVEGALAAHFGRPVPLRLVTDADVDGPAPASVSGSASPGGGGSRRAPVEELEEVSAAEVHTLEDAPDAATGAERLTDAFPGAELVDEP
jgi:DNA polymerase-3 subunit gamma/tau